VQWSCYENDASCEFSPRLPHLHLMLMLTVAPGPSIMMEGVSATTDDGWARPYCANESTQLHNHARPTCSSVRHTASRGFAGNLCSSRTRAARDLFFASADRGADKNRRRWLARDRPLVCRRSFAACHGLGDSIFSSSQNAP
jgi:hypothetical protein